MIGEIDELWDLVAIAEYPNRAAMLKMITDPDYIKSSEHREAGLEGQLNIEILNRFLPKVADNNFLGPKIAFYFFLLFMVVNTVRSFIHFLAEDAGLNSIANIIILKEILILIKLFIYLVHFGERCNCCFV